MPEKETVVVIGAGAAGMAASISAAAMGDHVILLERNTLAGKKLSATGNGRCNLMNRHTPAYFGGIRFADAVMQRCGAERQTLFWDELGLKLAYEEEGRVYPRTYQAASVLDALKTGLDMRKVDLRLQTDVLKLQTEKNRMTAVVQSRESGKYEISCDRVIIACGGAAQPRLGGNRSGYELLMSLGHSLKPIRPALTGIVTDPKSVSGLSGIRVRCRVRLLKGEESLCEKRGELLFTDWGVSGICVMQCSCLADCDGNVLELNLTDELFIHAEDALSELKLRRKRFAALSPQALLNGILLPRLSYAVCKQAGLSLRGEKTGELSDEQLRRVAETVTHYRIQVKELKGFDYAQVTAGGISCDEFDPETMASKINPKVHAGGEVLDVTGDCGGFNLMFAFGSGILAGENGRRARKCERET